MLTQLTDRLSFRMVLLTCAAVTLFAVHATAGPRSGDRHVAPDHRLSGHTDGIHAVAFLGDGSQAISASHDRTLRVWDVKTGKLVRTLEGHAGSVNCLAVAPDGKRVASGGGDKAARVWDTGTGELLAVLAGHTGGVNGVAFLPDDKLATVGDEGVVRLWDLKTEKELWRSEPDECGTALAASPDGHFAAYGDCSRRAHLIDLVQRRAVGTFGVPAELRSLQGLRFSRDNRFLVFSDGILHSLDLATLKLKELPQPNAGVARFAFSPDETIVASTNGTVWDAGTGKAICELEDAGAANCFAISADNRHVLAAAGGFYDTGIWKRLGSSDVYSYTLPDRNAPAPAAGAVSGSISWEPLSTVVRSPDGRTTPFADKQWRGQSFGQFNEPWSFCAGSYDAPDGKKPVDLLVAGGAVLMQREPGILDELISSPDDYGTAVFDGSHYFITSRKKGIVVLDAEGHSVATIGRSANLPQADLHLWLQVLGPGRVLATGCCITPSDQEGWCAVIERSGDPKSPRFTVKVFFRESQLRTVEGGWGEAFAGTGAASTLFIPSFITAPPGDTGNPRSVWIGSESVARSWQPILKMDPEKLTWTTFNLRPMTDAPVANARPQRGRTLERPSPLTSNGTPVC